MCYYKDILVQQWILCFTFPYNVSLETLEVFLILLSLALECMNGKIN